MTHRKRQVDRIIKSAGIAVDLEAPPQKRQGTSIEYSAPAEFYSRPSPLMPYSR
jgi:hypothetical protein